MPQTVQPEGQNTWTIVSIALFSAIASALVVGLVVANYREVEEPQQVRPQAKVASRAQPMASSRLAGDAPAPAAPAIRRPSVADIEHCNDEATSTRHRVEEAVKNAVIGGAIGAGVGAAGGAIADGGRGAGKGAGIGAVVGAAAGTLYGINKTNENSAEAQQAYRVCMARNGF